MFGAGKVVVCAAAALLCASLASAQSVIITQWNFNSPTPDANTASGTFVPNIGSGTPSLFGGLTQTPFDSGGTSSDPAGTNDNSAWRVATNAPQGQESGGRGVQFAVSTVGFSSITFTCDTRYSSSASKFLGVFYSIDGGTTFQQHPTVFFAPTTGDVWVNNQVADFSAIAGVANNANFIVRVAGIFEPNTSLYVPASASATYGLGGNTQRYDMVTFAGVPTSSQNPSGTAALATPNAVCAGGGAFTLSVRVLPGQVPVSTGIQVRANLTSVGGGNSVVMTDDGTSTGTYTLAGSVSVSTTPGIKNIPITITDLQGRTGSTSTTIGVGDCSANSASQVVISQIYGGGGNLGPPAGIYNADFVELYNRSNQVVNLSGWSVQYSSATSALGFDSLSDRVLLSGVIRPGQYLLVRYSDVGTNGLALPTPDFAVAAGRGGLGNNGGRVALVRSTNLLNASCTDSTIEDLASYGANAICFEGAGPAGTTANDTAVVRKLNGAQDSNQNFNDFSLAAPSPRNRSSGGFLAGFASIDEVAICSGNAVTITVDVAAATGPDSSGIQVRADLSSIGGSSNALLTNSGGSLYSITQTVALSTTQGAKTFAITTTDAQSRTDSTQVALTVATCTSSSAPIVISQILGGGGNADAPFNADFVEIFNRSGATVDLSTWSMQYASATSALGFTQKVNLSGDIAPGQYRLIRVSNVGANGGVLPTPDIIASPAFGMDNEFARVAIVNTQTLLGTSFPNPAIVDLVGYGFSALWFEGIAPTPKLSNTTVLIRKNGGCQDTDQNSIDFVVVAPLDNPRNGASPFNPCVQPSIVCCRGSTCSIVTSAAACTTTGFGAGASTPAGSTCNASGNNTTPCCHADYNKNGTVAGDVPDIFAFLGDWFANSPYAFFGGNGSGSGSPGVPAIFSFLGAWFAGCP